MASLAVENCRCRVIAVGEWCELWQHDDGDSKFIPRMVLCSDASCPGLLLAANPPGRLVEPATNKTAFVVNCSR